MPGGQAQEKPKKSHHSLCKANNPKTFKVWADKNTLYPLDFICKPPLLG
jgi:hypothetical protein